MSGNRGWRIVAVAANLIPAGLIFYFVHRFGVDVPVGDEWDACLIPLEKFHQGTLDLTALFAQHNEHRMLFPRLLTLANAVLFHWDRRMEMYVTAILLILCAWLYYRIVRTYWAHSLTPFLFVPVAWTLLSWRQWENLLMGMGTVFGLLATGAVVAFFLLYRTRGIDRFLWGAAAAAFVASFSSAGGLFVWPAGLVQLAISQRFGSADEKPGRRALMVWTGAGLLIWALFFIGYHIKSASWPTGFLYVIQNPAAAIAYMAGMIGGPFSDRVPIAQALGALVFVASAWAVFRLWRTPASLVAAAPLLAFMAFTALIVVSACDRRLGMGTGEGVTSRYCSMTMLSLVALYAVLTRFALTERTPVTWLASAGLAALMMGGALVCLLPWRHDPPGRADEYSLREYALRYADVVGDGPLTLLHPRPDTVRARTPFLREHRYSLFREDVPTGVPPNYVGGMAGCSIERVDDQSGATIDVSRDRDKSGVRVAGSSVKGSRVFVSVDGRIDVPGLSGPAGFISYIRTSLLTDGEHSLGLKVVSPDGASYGTCGTAHILVVK